MLLKRFQNSYYNQRYCIFTHVDAEALPTVIIVTFWAIILVPGTSSLVPPVLWDDSCTWWYLLVLVPSLSPVVPHSGESRVPVVLETWYNCTRRAEDVELEKREEGAESSGFRCSRVQRFDYVLRFCAKDSYTFVGVHESCIEWRYSYTCLPLY